MKQYIVIALGFLLGPLANAQPPVLIAEYRFEVMPGGINTTIPYYVNNLLLSAASNFTPGTGLAGPVGHTQGASLTNSNDRAYWGSSWNTVFDANDYFGFTLTPVVGYTLVVDRLTFYERRSGTGPQNWQLRRNPYSSTITAGVTTAGSASPVQTPFGFKNVPLALNSAATIGLRMYGYGSTDPAGTWRIDTVRVYGHLQGVFNLPIELTSFTGHKTLDGVELNWTTASERDNDYFTLLRCPDTESWEAIGNVDGAGNSTSPINYSFVDEDPLSGINYYQLEQTDTNGDHSLSHVVAIDFQNVFTLTHQVGSNISWDDKYTMVLDVSGRSVSDWQQSHTLSTPGIYFLTDKQGSVVRLNVTP